MEEKRKLAYPINKETRGTYIARRFTLPSKDERKKSDKEGVITELTRKLELHHDVTRFLIVRAEELPALGERESVPQILRRGRNDRQNSPAPRAPRPEAAQPVVEPVVPAPAPVAEPVVETPVAEVVVAEPVVSEATPVEAEAEAKPAKKKPAPRKKKTTTLEESEIDKKLDEVLNL
jgi:hypothetical protein